MYLFTISHKLIGKGEKEIRGKKKDTVKKKSQYITVRQSKVQAVCTLKIVTLNGSIIICAFMNIIYKRHKKLEELEL